jgi:hypothetical protein
MQIMIYCLVRFVGRPICRTLPQVGPFIHRGTMNGNHPSGPGAGQPGASAATAASQSEVSGSELTRVTSSLIWMPEHPKSELNNLVRVPFGMRRPKRQRPQRPDHWATVVIPFQLGGDPTPPPQAA